MACYPCVQNSSPTLQQRLLPVDFSRFSISWHLGSVDADIRPRESLSLSSDSPNRQIVGIRGIRHKQASSLAQVRIRQFSPTPSRSITPENIPQHQQQATIQGAAQESEENDLPSLHAHTFWI